MNRAGQPVWFSGSKLAADLSLPRLLVRWEQAAAGRERAGVGEGAASEVWVRRTHAVIERTRVALRRQPELVDGIAHAVGEVFAVLDHGQGHLVVGAGARFDRAARAPYRPVPAAAELAEELRFLARGLASSGPVSGGVALVELLAALAALALQISALLQERGRVHQARAARQTARVATGPQPTRPSVRPTSPLRPRSEVRPRRGKVADSPAPRARSQRSWRPPGSRPEHGPGPSPGRSR